MSVFEILVTFTDWLWKITLEVSFCVLLILVVRRFFGRFFGARMCRFLWLILFIRCLIPWSFPVQYHPVGLLHDIDIAFDSEPTTVPLPSPETVASPEILSDPALTPKPILPFTGFGFMLKTPRIAVAGLWGLGVCDFFNPRYSSLEVGCLGFLTACLCGSGVASRNINSPVSGQEDIWFACSAD